MFGTTVRPAATNGIGRPHTSPRSLVMSSARLALLVSGVVLAGCLLVGMISGPAPAVPVATAAPVPRGLKVPPRQIDLAEHLYCADWMKGVKRVGRSQREQEAADTIRSTVHTVGGPDLCLVAAENLEMAVWWTASAFGRGSDKQHWHRYHETKSPDAWVFIHLGATQSSPQEWEIRKVEVDGFTVRVVYGQTEERREAGLFTCDVHPYFVWANLGKLRPGRYHLELIDADNKGEVVVSRKVTVTE